MSLPLSHRRRLLAVVIATFVAAFAGQTFVVAQPAGAKARSAKSQKGYKASWNGVDTGKYYVFRTRDTGSAATNSQNTKCNNHFGLRAVTTLTRLNALLYSLQFADRKSCKL